MKRILLIILSLLIAGSLIACGDDDDDTYSDTAFSEASENYFIDVLVADKILAIRVIEVDGNNDTELFLGIEEVSELYKIKEVTPVTRKFWEGSVTSAFLLIVEPKY